MPLYSLLVGADGEQIEFPTMEAARAWHNDPEYQPHIKLRQTGSKVSMILVEGCEG
jgi:uncharacterized protein (DUF1330 family)